MAHIAETSHAGVVHSILHTIGGFFRIVGAALTVNANHEARLRKIEKLQAMTDEQLAELGIERERIVHYVFRDIYYV